MIEKIRKYIVKYCVRHINKDICITIFDKIATEKEKNNVLKSLKMILTQRNFNATLDN